METHIDILAATGQTTGKIASKSEIHSKGYYHNTAHIWFYSDNEEILLAQRAATKTIKPLLWDVSVAGHVDAGETITEAAIRETHEEIGLQILEKDLHKIGVFPSFKTYENGIIDNEFHHTFIAKLTIPLSKLKPQPNEVEALQLVSLEQFKSLLENSEHTNYFVADNKKYYLEVLKALKPFFS